MAHKMAVMADTPEDYERLGLSHTTIAQWDDGARTNDSAGTSNGGTSTPTWPTGRVVLSFVNKDDIADSKKTLAPLPRLTLDLSDGRHFEKIVRHPPGEWSGAKDHADVRLGENRFAGDLHRYRIQAKAG